ncbi:MAG: hypothetical protein AAGJ93_03290 [Bacteroidota bacterium]
MNQISIIKKQFLHALKLGTGATYLLQRKHPEIDFSNEILSGALENFAYDPQSEGSRADYIFGLMKAAPRKAEIIACILETIVESEEDSWDLYHLLDIAVLIYQDGNAQALMAIAERFGKSKRAGYDFCGDEQLMEVGGIEGVLLVGELIGERLLLEQEDDPESWKLAAFQEQHPTIDIYAILKEKAKDNKFLQAYYDTIIQNPPRSYKSGKITPPDYQTLKEKIEADRLRLIGKERASLLREEDVLKLANDFRQAKNRKVKEGYLRFFAKRKFPGDHNILLSILQNEDPEQGRLVELAAQALSFFKDQRIRELAKEKIRTVYNPASYLPLLVSNYEEGDSQLLLEVIDRSDDFDFIHSLINGLLAIYKTNKTEEAQVPLEAMYDKMNCGLHRMDIIEMLYENDILSERIHQEIAYDSMDTVRALYEKM